MEIGNSKVRNLVDNHQIPRNLHKIAKLFTKYGRSIRLEKMSPQISIISPG